jgi:regulatory associated protein of mTOR
VSIALLRFDDYALSNMMAALPSRPPAPQPVLINFLEPDAALDTNGHTELEDRPSSAPKMMDAPLALPALPILKFPLTRSSTHFVTSPRLAPERDRSTSPDARPTLLRAKSDFGPRREEPLRTADVESRTSGEGEWGIRHGFETQLVSEEYNNLLTSVCVRELQATFQR